MLMAVYGTLRKGQGNHRFMSNSKFIGYGVLKGWEFCVGRLTIKNTGNGFVIVEVYDVPESDVPAIDRLEGYPYIYNREEVDVIIPGVGVVKAWVYYIPNITRCITTESYITSERLR